MISLRIACLSALSMTVPLLPAMAADDGGEATAAKTGMTQMNCGAKIECITPDGHTNPVSKLPAVDPAAAALIMEDDTVSCLLQEGVTNFVVELPKSRLLDRLIFLNENARARGELRIAISNSRLKPASAGWREVEGVVPFSHKRLFGVSLIGIEANFVRLSFRVEKTKDLNVVTNESQKEAQTGGANAPIREAFTSSALHDALDSPLATRQTRDRILLTAANDSVGPITAFAR